MPDAQTSGREGKTLKTFTADSKAACFTGRCDLIDRARTGAAERISSLFYYGSAFLLNVYILAVQVVRRNPISFADTTKDSFFFRRS